MFSCFNSLIYLWNLGFTLSLGLFFQMVSGLVLAFSYETSQAFEVIDRFTRDSNGWMWSQSHSTGATLYFMMIYLHILSSIYSGSMNNTPWLTGLVMYLVSLVCALLGYSLANGNMALWALTVVSSLLTSMPKGSELFKVLMGNFMIDNTVLPSIYTIHFVLGLSLVMIILIHLSEVHKTESSTDLKVRSMMASQDFLGSGATKDMLMMLVYLLGLNLGFLEQSFISTLCEDCHAVDWPQPDRTPNPIGPEWYFLFLYAGLKTSKLHIGMVALILLMTILIRIDALNSNKAMVLVVSLCTLGVVALNGHEAIEELQMMACYLLLSILKSL